jgi:putative thiamine transport system substrate-binding protein
MTVAPTGGSDLPAQAAGISGPISAPRRRALRALGAAVLSCVLASPAGAAPETRNWAAIAAAARGQTVYWNAWAGDERTNAFIAWVGAEVKQRYGVSVQQVNLKDTAEAVTRVVSEKTAGRDSGGSVDLVWINGPNFLAMKEKGLLHGPFTQVLPNYRLVDTTTKRSNVVDFTVPVDGLESPWRLAQLVYVYDSARHRPESMPRSIPALLDWSRAHPGRLTHPTVRNFLGATFLKQALVELAPSPEALQSPATDANFGPTTAPLWAWYDRLLPTLWRAGREFPESGPAQRQLLNDGEIDLLISFSPAEAATSIANRLLPPTVRVFGSANGTIGNTSFVAIPYNAAHKEGAMVVANFLLDPIAQARQQDPTVLGHASVLDLAKLGEAERALFAPKPGVVGLPPPGEPGRVLLEPHASWMTRITAEWEKRYSR